MDSKTSLSKLVAQFKQSNNGMQFIKAVLISLVVMGTIVSVLIQTSTFAVGRDHSTHTPTIESNIQTVASISTYTDDYFSQLFDETPTDMLLTGLSTLCAKTAFRRGLYVTCTNIDAGLFNQVNSIKSCIRLAIDAGANLILPALAERDSNNLVDFHLGDPAFTFGFSKVWDGQHLFDGMERACPNMEILLANATDTILTKHKEVMDVGKIANCRVWKGCFGYARPFKSHVDQVFAALNIPLDRTQELVESEGNVVIELPWTILTYNSDDDPTGLDWTAWADISTLLRFPEVERNITRAVLAAMYPEQPWIGIHLRVESDTKNLWWDPFDLQTQKNLNVAQAVWPFLDPESKYTPTIYLACGDQERVTVFTSLAAARGFTTINKWSLAGSNPKIQEELHALHFDQMAGVDYGVLLRSTYFLGQAGSSFSYSLANARGGGKYRGSSYFEKTKDGTHLFPPNSDGEFGTCL